MASAATYDQSAVKAMTAIQEFSKERIWHGHRRVICYWRHLRGDGLPGLLPPVMKGVKGVAPLVYDNLNIKAQFGHQRDLWGDLSAQVHDYTDLGLDKLVEFPIGR